MEGKKLKKGIDYYLNENGYMVFTEKYLLDRGTCCKSCCKHCPYGYKKNCQPAEKVSSIKIG
jgi:hypothetical protein